MERTNFPQLDKKTETLFTEEKIQILEKRVETLEESLRTVYETLTKEKQEGSVSPDRVNSYLERVRQALQIKRVDSSSQTLQGVEEEKRKLWIYGTDKLLNAEERGLRLRERDLENRELELALGEKELELKKENLEVLLSEAEDRYRLDYFSRREAEAEAEAAAAEAEAEDED